MKFKVGDRVMCLYDTYLGKMGVITHVMIGHNEMHPYDAKLDNVDGERIFNDSHLTFPYDPNDILKEMVK